MVCAVPVWLRLCRRLEPARCIPMCGNRVGAARFVSSPRVDQLPIPEVLKQNLIGMGVTKLFDIQTRAFDVILRGKSFVGRSKTGTGKTVAYLLPLLERMRHEKVTSAHSLIILVPTRELCKQVGSILLSLSVHSDVALVYGGPGLDSQEQLVRLGATTIVATPGRCAQLIHRGAIDTKNVRALVIDEADAMFGPQFVGTVSRVVTAVAKQGLQHILFSASLPPDVLTLVQTHFPDHVFVDLVDRHGKSGDAVVQAVDHRLCKLDDRRLAARARIVLHVLSERLDLSGGRCIIFADTAHETRTLLSHPALGHRAQAVHNDLSLTERDRVLTAFANFEFDVLITTDVLSRGIDFADVNLILQLHPPKKAVQYIHRSGRTGRAGQGGTCITFYDASERKLVQQIRAVTNHDFAILPFPGPLNIHNASVSRLLEQMFSVQPEEYEQVIEDASQLLEEQGPSALATAMAILDSRHADLQRAVRDRPSILSGKKGYVCVLANDPDHTVATTEGEAQRIVGSLLPKTAVMGRVARVAGGWALDVQHHHAGKLVEDLRSGRASAPFEVVVAQRMPKVLRASSRSARRAKLLRLPMAAQVENREAATPKEKIEEEAREHLKSLEAHVEIKTREELVQAAKMHRDKNACTEFDETTGQYKYKSCCGTGVNKLGVFGVGVLLYFQFLRQMGFVFLLCAIVLGANSAFNLMGNMVNENSALYKYLGMTTIGNLGACESGRCQTDEEAQERCLWNVFPCEIQLREATQWLGLADGVGILLVLAWGIYFKNRHIPRVVQANDDAHLTPPDFAVDITVLPYKLADGHEEYKEKLKQHFISILRSLGFDDSSAVAEITLVRNYDGAISTFLKKGNIILSQHGDIIRMKELEGKEDSKSKKSYEKLEKTAITKYKQMKKLERSISTQAAMTDEQRGVVRAFVTFSKSNYKEKVLDHYRFSRFFMFRCCQNKDLRFEGSPLLVKQADEPSDLYWENLDFAYWKRLLRVAFVILLTFVLLVVCSAALVFFQSLSKSTLAGQTENLVWVVKSSGNSSCLGFCDLEMFSDRLCTSNGDTSAHWGTVKVFDEFNDYNTTTWDSACSSPWASPCSSSTSYSQHQSTCGVSATQASKNTDWIGFQFEDPQQVQCWKATFPANINPTEVQLFGCPSEPPAVANRTCWNVEDYCAPMYPNELTTTTPNSAWLATDNKVSADKSCSTQITEEVAKARWESFSEGSNDRILNPIISCFCQQQALSQGPGFAFPPFDTDSKMVCQDWILNNAAVLGKVIGAALAVLVINQILLLIYEYLVAFERHCTVTEVTLSQFWKLFLAQMVNTALLVLLVNASLELPPVLQFLRVLQVGSGQFDELSVTWYVSVGTGICITIFAQVFSTTVPPLIMAFVVKPCLSCIFSRGEVVQARLNQVYVLPPWNLSLRMAQTLTVIFVICTYSGGMPLLYVVGFVYGIVAFWLDKWCLLKGSSKPPAYNQSILMVCCNFLPLAAFFHTVIAGWTYGNQSLVPSDWSYLLFVAEMLFMSEAEYEAVTAEYLSAPARVKPTLQWKYREARMMDMARQGCWLIFCIFLVFVVYYIVVWTYKLLLKPFLSPFLFMLTDCCRRKAAEENAATWEECLRECKTKNILSSYALSQNDKYYAAAVAIEHGDERAKRGSYEAGDDGEKQAEL